MPRSLSVSSSRRSLVTCSLVALSLTAMCGCQTWSTGGYPLQNVSRVPPPGTGTYQLPNGYYNNNTTAVAPNGQVMTASTNTGGLRPASGGLPTTTLAGFSASQNQVQPAQFTQPPSASQFGPASMSSGQNVNQVIPASGTAMNNVHDAAYQSQSMSDAASTGLSESLPDTSDLQWQQ